MNVPKGKYFFAVSRLNGLVLDVVDRCSKPGTPVCIKERNVSLNENQLWYEDLVTGTIRTKLNDALCLELSENNTFVVNLYDPRSTNQRWEKGGTRRDRIEHGVDSGRFLEVASNRRRSQLISTTFRNTDNQKFTFEHVDTDYFHMVSEVNGKSLDVRGGFSSRKAGTPVIVSRSNGCLTQQWYEDLRGGIRARLNDFDLSVLSLENGGVFTLEPHQEGLQYKSQIWTCKGNKICNMFNPHLVLDIQRGDEDTQATVWQYKDVSNQHWKFPTIWEKYGKKP